MGKKYDDSFMGDLDREVDELFDELDPDYEEDE